MDLVEYIPFEEKKFRPQQKEAIEEIIDAFENGVETVLLDAPVGLGKSIIGYCVARHFQEYGKKSYIYTKTTFLQQQYLNDFTDIKTAMGRSNFNCIMSGSLQTCDVGNCKVQKKYSCPVGAVVDEGVYLKSLEPPFEQHCPYWLQKFNAIQNDISILNYSYAITDNMYLNHFDNRFLGVFDEGHGLEAALMSALEVEITDYQIKNDLDTTLSIKPDIESWISELIRLGELYKTKAELISDTKRKERFLDRSKSLKQCASFLEKNPDNWVFNVSDRKNDYANRYVKQVVFKPIEIQEFTDLLFSKTEHKLIMSGSILKADIFINELGLDEINFKYIQIYIII